MSTPKLTPEQKRQIEIAELFDPSAFCVVEDVTISTVQAQESQNQVWKEELAALCPKQFEEMLKQHEKNKSTC